MVPDTTSYDYSAPLTEAGNYTRKYALIKSLLAKYANPKTKLPTPPEVAPRVVYPSIPIKEYLPLKELTGNYQPPHVHNAGI